MSFQVPGARSLWPLRPRRRHPAAALPAGSSLSEPPEGLDLDTAKVALEQVNKRLDAELALKTSTETRAITLAGQCTTLLTAITAALLVEIFGGQRAPLIAAGVVGVVCLLLAVIFAYSSANPRQDGVLPGRLPDELWDDFVAPDMKGAEFIGRLLLGLQDAMVRNEENQARRARALSRAITMVRLAVPLSVGAAILFAYAPPRLIAGATHEPFILNNSPAFEGGHIAAPPLNPSTIAVPSHVDPPAGPR